MTKKVVLIVLGVIVGLIGLVGSVGAAVGLIVASNGVFQTGFHPLTTSTNAFESPTTDINTYSYASPTLKFEANSVHGVFVGIGPAASVNQYLSGSAVTTITSFDVWPYSITTSNRAGSATPAAPAQQTFWVAKGSGANSASLNWKVTTGTYKLVIMRTDGSSNVAVQARIGVKIPHFTVVAIVGLVVALLLLGLGILLLVLGIRSRPAPNWSAGPPGGMPPGPPPQPTPSGAPPASPTPAPPPAGAPPPSPPSAS